MNISTPGTEPGRVKLPEATAASHGPARYQALYDDPGNRLVIVRNGQRILDLKLRKEPAANAEAAARMRHGVVPVSMAQRTFERRAAPLKFNEFHVEPWDGVPPKARASRRKDGDEAFAGEPPEQQYGDARGRKAGVRGQRRSWRFSGVEKPLHAGMLVRLQKRLPLRRRRRRRPASFRKREGA